MRKTSVALLLVFSMILSFSASAIARPETSYIDPTEGYVPIVADNEDSTLNLWFEHSFNKVLPTNITSSGLNTYCINMAKNEIEGAQFILYSAQAKTGLTAEITDFEDGEGNVLVPELFYEYYSKSFAGKTPDAIPPLVGSFDLTAGNSKAFYYKVTTEQDTPAGLYTATLTIKDSEQNEIKKANIFLMVWNVVLSEETASKTAIMLDYASIERVHKNAGSTKTGKELYTIYYEYLLENRINAFHMPSSIFERNNDAAVWMNNPRVTTFAACPNFGYPSDVPITNDQLTFAYNKLKNNPEWLEKAYFYTVDEPHFENNYAKVQAIINEVPRIKTYFPDAKIMIPQHLNFQYGSVDTDVTEVMKDYVDIWCPKTLAFTDRALFGQTGVEYMTSSGQDEKYGAFPDRMYEEVAQGKELWWYVASGPSYPYAQIMIDSEGIAPRVLFWQQKMYDVEGFLYYWINDWSVDYNHPTVSYWDSRPYYRPNTSVVEQYGNGMLIYDGAKVGIEGPVGSLRLEALRDGIEDFQVLTMYQEKYGKDSTNELISDVTEHIASYNSDSENFIETKIALFEALANDNEPCADGEHEGGQATCISRAFCDICGYTYGEVGEHTYSDLSNCENRKCVICNTYDPNPPGHTTEDVTAGDDIVPATATCQIEAVCGRCGLSYGGIVAHDYNDDGNCVVCGVPYFDGTPAEEFERGQGTDEDPYIISNAAQLAYFAQLTNSGVTFEGEYIQLDRDIYYNDLSIFTYDEDGYVDGIVEESNVNTWEQASLYPENAFKGTLWGAGHTVYGLYTIDSAGGLIGYSDGATIDGLTISDSYFNSIYDTIGGIVSLAENTDIINCTNNATVIGLNSVGGIVGEYISNSGDNKFYRCINNGKVMSTGTFAEGDTSNSATGGLIGKMDISSGSSFIIDCSANNGPVTGKVGHAVGGLVGNGNANGDFTIAQSYNTGEILSNASWAAGIVGMLNKIAASNVLITECYNSGLVSASAGACGFISVLWNGTNTTISNSYNSGNLIGGGDHTSTTAYCQALVGNHQGGTSYTATNCYYLDSCNAYSETKAARLTASNMKNAASFINFDFNDTWTMDGCANYLYPELQWVNASHNPEDYDESEFKVEKEPSCSIEGIKYVHCALCQEKVYGTIAASGEHVWDEGVVTPKTCTVNGYTTYTCTLCGETNIDDIVPAAHDYERVINPPTCRSDGYTFDVCSVCNDTKTISQSAKLGHIFLDDTGICRREGCKYVEYYIGDINYDKVIDDVDDMLLTRYLANWDVEINEYAADFNIDDAIDDIDAMYLARYLASWPMPEDCFIDPDFLTDNGL